MGRGLSPARLKKLTQALETLPNQLRYLNAPILSLARQDQDLLGCGESDCSLFETAWKQEMTGLEPDAAAELAASHAEALQEWASTVGDENSMWLGPVWFLTGYFQGPAFGGMAEAQSAVEPAPQMAVEIIIPPHFQSHEGANGWSFGDDRVWMTLLTLLPAELDELKDAMSERASMSQAELSAESLIRDGHGQQCDPSFRIGEAYGLRYLECVEATGHVFAARYFLSVPGGHIQLLMNSLTDGGFEIAQYEPLIKSICVSPASSPA